MDFSGIFNYRNPKKAGENNSDNEPGFLYNFTPNNWEKFLVYTSQLIFHENEVAIRNGEEDKTLFIVVSGEFEVLIHTSEKQKPHVLQTITAGSVFGELSFLDGKPRSATVRATKISEVIKLNRDELDEMAAKEPALARIFLLELGRILSLRLRNMNKLIHSYRK